MFICDDKIQLNFFSVEPILESVLYLNIFHIEYVKLCL